MQSQNRTHPARFVLSSLAAVVLAVSLGGCLSGGGGSSSSNDEQPGPINRLQVSTQQGDYIGISDAGMRIFRGIRYGQAERFASPEFAPAHEPAIQLSDAFGSGCPQVASPFGAASVDEDCLFLNVYAPEEPGEYPVMVWLHGGAFIYGSGGATYDPARLVEQGVVVVTLNYRLGALGFLPHADLGNANFGLQDQQLALQWVQQNIDQFDGDANNVTLFGESAGGHSVMSQLASPGATGLFHKAIVQSGSYNGEQLPLPLGQLLFGNPTVAATDCATSTSDQLLACLRSQSVQDILAAQPGNILPVWGTAALPQSINAALASGDFNQVPVMMGSNRNEGSLFTLLALADDPTALDNPANYIQAVKGLLGENPALDAQQVAIDYLTRYADHPVPTLGAYNAIGTDWRFNCPNSNQWNLLQDQVPTWGYWFADEEAPPIEGLPSPFPLGATHTAELQYIFSSRGELIASGATDEQLQLADHMAAYWTNFAKYGDDPAIGPNATDGAAEAVEWPRLLAGGQVLRLDTPAPAAVAKSAFDATHNCAYWRSPPLL
ncbi:MAG TPA: carboxylesterase family protein [Pseudomonadaceae bacterium]|nr:carboxylesterase family protein [Pseudomonadaceae bacterium]